MKFDITCEAFRDAFSTASYTVDKVKNAGATRMMLVQAETKNNKPRVLFFATDGVAAIVTKTEAQVEEAGATLVEPKELGICLPNLPGDGTLSFTHQDGALQLKCGRFKPKCSSDDPTSMVERFKQLPLKEKSNLDIPGWKLREVFDRVIGFASIKEENLAQAFMQNVYLRVQDQGLEAYTASDGILAKARVNGLTVPDGTDFRVDIPARAIPALQKILANPIFKRTDAANPPQIKFLLKYHPDGGGNLYVRTNDIFYGVGLRNDRIPQKAIDSEGSMGKMTNAGIQLNREEFIATVRRCQPFLGGNLLRISLADNQLTVLDHKKEELDVLEGAGEKNGESKICLDSRMVLNVLNSAKEDTLQVRFLKNGNAALVDSGNDETGRGFYVVLASPDPTEKEESK